MFASSDGSGTANPNDLWVGTDDALDGSGTPAIIHYIHGPGALKPVSVEVIGDNIQWTYDITVSAGQTISLAYFTIVAATRTEAVAAANSLVTPTGFGGQAAGVSHSRGTSIDGELREHESGPIADRGFTFDLRHK